MISHLFAYRRQDGVENRDKAYFSLVLIEVINGPAKRLLLQTGAKKTRGRDAGMLSCLIYFFAKFSIHKIPHNYVILQTHSAFYPHLLNAHFEVFFFTAM